MILTRIRINHEIANPDPNDPLFLLEPQADSDEDIDDEKMMKFNREKMGYKNDTSGIKDDYI